MQFTDLIQIMLLSAICYEIVMKEKSEMPLKANTSVCSLPNSLWNLYNNQDYII